MPVGQIMLLRSDIYGVFNLRHLGKVVFERKIIDKLIRLN
jgi:hypothetical protein